MKFQGGFAAKRLLLESRQEDGTFTTMAEFYPDDHGKLQISFFSFGLSFSFEEMNEMIFLNSRCTSFVFQQLNQLIKFHFD